MKRKFYILLFRLKRTLIVLTKKKFVLITYGDNGLLNVHDGVNDDKQLLDMTARAFLAVNKLNENNNVERLMEEAQQIINRNNNK